MSPTPTQPIDIKKWKNYGMAWSDVEGSWPPELKAKMRKVGFSVVFGSLNFWQKLKFGFLFMFERKRISGLDLSDLKANGMNNEAFLKQQFEYLALFAALKRVIGKSEALRISKKLMDATAKEPMLYGFPTAEDLKDCRTVLPQFSQSTQSSIEASNRAGCLKVEMLKSTADEFSFGVTWCIWLELATRAGVPEACIPNCYADEIAFPEYFKQFGITYSRPPTLAEGGSRCEFCFRKNP
jgi:hypothetical protein